MKSSDGNVDVMPSVPAMVDLFSGLVLFCYMIILWSIVSVLCTVSVILSNLVFDVIA